MELTKILQIEYEDSWKNCQINQSYADDLYMAVERILLNKHRYKSVSLKTGVPWYVIAVIHSLESDCDFRTHLHNGDSLEHRTINVPEGRPATGDPPFSWEYSAEDALSIERALCIKCWNLSTLFWFLEGFNGWGYREGKGRKTTPPCRSPYIYSGTRYYESGKYTADGTFDEKSVSDQIGCMALLKELELRNEINISPSQILFDSVGTVAAWQHLLNGCGYCPVLEINDLMDSYTINATKKFQSDLGLNPTGEVDITTWQAACSHKKLPLWTNSVPPVIDRDFPQPSPAASTITGRLYEYYSQLSNYQKVLDDVMDWRGTTCLSCVAFVSTALRLSGYQVYDEPDINGDSPLVWTAALSSQLIERGWLKSEEASDLMPGDIVFTIGTGSGEDEGVPDHVYMFAGWDDEEKLNAWVIDNQKFLHLRNIYAYGDFQFTPFWYFLRA
jgi:lysozyme family protein